MSYAVTGHRKAIGAAKKAKGPSTAWGRTGRHLYFIRENGTDGYVKIGRTDNVDRRLATLQSGNPRRLILIKTLPDRGPDEPVWHARFKNDRVKGGEWFKPSKTLLDAVTAGGLPAGSTKLVKKTAPKKQVYVAGRRLIS